MVLDKYIRELLFREDCVIIPGLGGFVSKYASAEIRGETQSFIPPTKKIGFNAELIDDDGMLANYVAEEMDRPVNVVREMIVDQVKETLALLSSGETVNLEGIGDLNLEKGKTLIFRANLGTNFLLESFGLSSFTFPVLEAEKESFFKRSTIFRTRHKSSSETLPGSQNEANGKDNTTSKLVIALVSLLIISLLPFNSRISESIFRHPATLGPLPSLRLLETPQDQQYVSENLVIYQLENQVPEKPEIVQQYTFPIIAGSFPSVKNAEELSQKLISLGYQAKFSKDKRSFYRVIISEYPSLDEAERAFPDLQKRNRNLDLWILK